MFNKKAQTTLEYAIVVAVIVAALLGMQIYMKRSVEGRLKSSTDNIGEQFDPHNTGGKWYEYSNSSSVETTLNQITKSASIDPSLNYNKKYGGETVMPEPEE